MAFACYEAEPGEESYALADVFQGNPKRKILNAGLSRVKRRADGGFWQILERG